MRFTDLVECLTYFSIQRVKYFKMCSDSCSATSSTGGPAQPMSLDRPLRLLVRNDRIRFATSKRSKLSICPFDLRSGELYQETTCLFGFSMIPLSRVFALVKMISTGVRSSWLTTLAIKSWSTLELAELSHIMAMTVPTPLPSQAARARICRCLLSPSSNSMTIVSSSRTFSINCGGLKSNDAPIGGFNR